jgi:hypothetical protein
MYARKEDEATFPMESVGGSTKIGFEYNCRNNVNIQGPTCPGAAHNKTDS